MFTITSTRIVGLIAVVCAVVAPQALAASSTHSRIAPPGDEPSGFAAVTLDAVQGNGVSGFDLGDLKNGRVAFTAVPQKSVEAGSTAAAIKALQRRSVALNALYRKLYPGAYRHGSLQTNPGWGAAATAAKESAAALAVTTAPLGWFCFDQAKYEYVRKACE